MPQSRATETAVLHAEMVSREEPSYFDDVFFLLLGSVGDAINLVRTSPVRATGIVRNSLDPGWRAERAKHLGSHSRQVMSARRTSDKFKNLREEVHSQVQTTLE